MSKDKPHIYVCDGCGQKVIDSPSFPTCTKCDGTFFNQTKEKASPDEGGY